MKTEVVVVKAVYEVVTMDQVPEPPVTSRGGRRPQIYEAIKALGLGERHAVKVKCANVKDFTNTRQALRAYAKRDGKMLMLCSSRNADYTEAYFWLVKKGS